MRPAGKKAVVIGAGLGGLAAALRLAARGWSVTVCEQTDSPGGKMNRWEANGFRFDTGPSLITMPWVFEELFEAAGTRLRDHVEMVCVHPLAEYRFDDGTRFIHTANLPDWLTIVRRFSRFQRPPSSSNRRSTGRTHPPPGFCGSCRCATGGERTTRRSATSSAVRSCDRCSTAT